MKNYLIPVKNDLFDIADRLRAIDSGYTVFYNKLKKRYEVFNDNNGGGLAFVVPFDELDARTVEYAQRTRVSRMDSLIAEIDAQ